MAKDKDETPSEAKKRELIEKLVGKEKKKRGSNR
jgi:hypothetical protein